MTFKEKLLVYKTGKSPQASGRDGCRTSNHRVRTLSTSGSVFGHPGSPLGHALSTWYSLLFLSHIKSIHFRFGGKVGLLSSQYWDKRLRIASHWPSWVHAHTHTPLNQSLRLEH